jgi:hypothetical protein
VISRGFCASSVSFVRASLLSVLLILSLSVGAIAKDKKAETEDETSEKAPAAEKKSTAPAEFDIPVPAGVPVKGIKIPYYSEDGNTLLMTFDAEVARRVDDENIEMENLKIDGKSDDGSKFTVALPQSVFNLETRILTGNNGVVIARDDFEITGQSAEFHAKTRFGKVIGDVKMIILNTDNLE